MEAHPVNLMVRFLLEVLALVLMGLWGWRQGEGWLRFVLAIALPLIAAAAWGVFAVPDDPSRSGNAPVAVPGFLRLGLELAFFAFAIWALNDLGFRNISWILTAVILLHYALSYDRIQWLLKQ